MREARERTSKSSPAELPGEPGFLFALRGWTAKWWQNAKNRCLNLPFLLHHRTWTHHSHHFSPALILMFGEFELLLLFRAVINHLYIISLTVNAVAVWMLNLKVGAEILPKKKVDYKLDGPICQIPNMSRLEIQPTKRKWRYIYQKTSNQWVSPGEV